MDGTCRLRRGEGYGACADEGASIAFGSSPASRLPAKCLKSGRSPYPLLQMEYRYAGAYRM